MQKAFCLVAMVLSLVVLSQPPCRGGEGEDSLGAARKQMLIDKNYELAARGFRKFIEKHPRHPQAPVAIAYMALCYTALNRPAEAADSYTRLLEKYPNASRQLRQDAMSYGGDAAFKAGRFAEAAERYSQLLAEFPDSPPVKKGAIFSRAQCWQRLAEMDGNRGDPGKQKDYLTKALADYAAFATAHPDTAKAATALLSAGKISYQLGDYRKTVELCRKFMQAHGDDKRSPEALLCLAGGLLKLKEYEEARKAYLGLLARQPQPGLAPELQAGLAWCNYYLGNFSDAAEGFAKAAETTADDPAKAAGLHFQAGRAYQEAGAARQAEEQYLKVAKIKGHPQQGNALLQLGLLKTAESRNATVSAEGRHRLIFAAIDYFEKALPLLASHKEDSLNARLFLGETLIEAKEFARAAKTLGEVAQAFPESRQAPWALYNQALSLNKAGQPGKAAEVVAGLVKKYPDSPVRLQAVYASADFYLAAKRTPEARQAYDWLARKSVSWAAEVRDEGGNPNAELVEKAKQFASDALFRIAELCKSEGKFSEARQNYRLFISQYPEHSEVGTAHLRLAAIAEAEKNLDQAENEYSLALAQLKDKTKKIEATYRLAIINLSRAQQEDDEEKRTALLAGAQKGFDAFIKTNPEAPRVAQAYYYRAEAEYTGGFKEKALADYNLSLRKEPQGEYSDQALFGAAWCLHDLGKLDESGATFKKLMDDFPASPRRPEALYLFGMLKEEAGEPEAAEEVFSALVKEYPQHPRRVEAELEKGKLLLGRGETEAAAEIFAGLLAQIPAHPRAEEVLQKLSWAWQAVLTARQQAVKAAEAALRDLIGDKPAATLTGEMKTAAAPLLAARDSAREAAAQAEIKLKSILKRLAKEYPTGKSLGMVNMRLGEIEYHHGRYLPALEYYSHAYKAASGNPASDLADKALYRLAWCYLHLAEPQAAPGIPGNGDKPQPTGIKSKQWQTMALKYFQMLVAAYPQSGYWADSCFRSAELQRGFKEYETAIENYTRALQSAPGARFARAAQYGIQLCNLGLKQYDSALKNATAFLARYPQGAYLHEANWVLGEALFRLESYADAEKHFTAALANRYAGKVAAKSQYGLGMIALQQGRLADARKAFYKVAALYSRWRNWAAQALLEASRISIKLGQKDNAATDLKRILRYYPQTPAAVQARELLQNLTRNINLRLKNYFETRMIRV